MLVKDTSTPQCVQYERNPAHGFARCSENENANRQTTGRTGARGHAITPRPNVIGQGIKSLKSMHMSVYNM